MVMKLHLFLLASFLLATTSVSTSNHYFPFRSVSFVAITPAPAKTALYAPGAKPPSPPPSPPVAKPPTPTPPVAKPPTATPPVAKPPTAAPPTPPRNTKECYPPCLVRCKLHSRQNVCLRACVTCCDRCKCVPPGQSGNREVCGTCYTNMTTHGGRPKCP
ncbi:hypothetical protein SSX86_014598 [Deinandra increscens subsp. villosa]|uniref:Gibberellin-regulated protein 14 n=1 Tax=Deinandra increscens subsp. villosa TaxID=3103831 RepID=A0AAP0H0H3_9ASTR